jgi:hypothetical protein
LIRIIRPSNREIILLYLKDTFGNYYSRYKIQHARHGSYYRIYGKIIRARLWQEITDLEDLNRLLVPEVR